MDVLATRVGDGITGHVAATGEPFLTGDAAHCGIGVHIQGTTRSRSPCSPSRSSTAPRVVGVIVVSKLGLDQFDSDDLRLLEVLAGHVSVALVNARLYEAQRREAESAKALLELTRELSAVTNLDGVLEQVVKGAARIMGSRRMLDLGADASRRRARVPRSLGDDESTRAAWVALSPRTSSRAAPGAMRAVRRHRATRPSSLGRALDPRALADAARRLVHPVDRGCGACRRRPSRTSTTRELELLAGIASQARLAITNAGSFATLERTFLSTVEALANALEAKD